MTTAVADARAEKIHKSLAAGEARAQLLRNGPILSTLARLSFPNLIALCSAAIVSIAETAYVGSLGVAPLGGIALAFPIFMLMQMLSAGAMGGTVSGAISRALGAGDYDRAQSLALCTFVIGLVFGLALTVVVRFAGPPAYVLLGGSGEVLREAIAYSNVAAFAIVAIWTTNMLASIARGSGNMAIPAWTILLAGVTQVVVGGTLGLGLGPAPRLGMAGVAMGQVIAFGGAALVLLIYLRSTSARLRLRFAPSMLAWPRFAEILKVGAIAMLSPLLSVTTILVLTALVTRFGPEALAGYGIGVRFEFLLIPIAFSIGVASVPMVGTAIGASDILRARRIAWTAGGVSASVLGSSWHSRRPNPRRLGRSVYQRSCGQECGVQLHAHRRLRLRLLWPRPLPLFCFAGGRACRGRYRGPGDAIGGRHDWWLVPGDIRRAAVDGVCAVRRGNDPDGTGHRSFCQAGPMVTLIRCSTRCH